MLTAAHLLANRLRSSKPPSLQRDIVFVSLTGESVDLTGSRRFLYELEQGSNSTKGIGASQVHSIIEVGMTAGLPGANGTSNFYMHGAKAQSAVNAALTQAVQGSANVTVRFLRPWPLTIDLSVAVVT
jgi:hypothetical protein